MNSMMGKMSINRHGKSLLGLGLLLLVLSLFISGCSSNRNRDFKIIAADGSLSQGQKVEEILEGMTLEEKIGQMICAGVTGTEFDAEARGMFERYHFGGLVEFDYNLESREQVWKLNQQLQDTTQGKLPLFIAVDEEGGQVARMRHIVPPPPSQLSIAQTGRPELAKEWAVKISGQLKDLGFNVNFAPVADLGSFKDRHYSNNPKIAADFVDQAAMGYEESGMLYSLKHFPGIGRGKADTHVDRVVVDATLEQLNDTDLAPFVRVLNRNTHDRQLIMISHIVYPKIGGQMPASLSPDIMTKLLREKLGYKGIIITDDMAMGAVSRFYTPGDAAVQSVLAGADIVMSCHVYRNQAETAEALLTAVNSGKISEERINESVRRIIRAKLNLVAPRMGLIIKRSLAD
ncbi:Beta-hexosaminidase [Anaerovibrio sp. JC8]|nr:Beta-hexosaminidase [Anaerovibrio sp. JC8]